MRYRRGVLAENMAAWGIAKVQDEKTRIKMTLPLAN
jgi:hypothetical protein